MEKIRQFFFVNTNNKQTVVKNTFWLFVGEIGMRLLKLAIFIFAARRLGASEWGIFSYSLALMTFFEIIADIGLNSVLLRETAKKTENGESYVSAGFFLKVGLSLIASFALLSLFFFVKNTNELKALIPITAFMLFFDSMREFGFALNRAYEKMELEAVAKISATLVLVVFGFIFIFYHGKAISLSYAYALSGIVGIAIMYFSLRKHFRNLAKNFNKKLLIPIFKEAWPIGIVGILGTVMASVDIIILGWFRNAHEIGLYSAAQKPIQIIYLVPTLISTAILPIFSRLVSLSKEQMDQAVSKAVSFSIAIALPIALLGVVIGGPVFVFLFGAEYASAVPVFKIMILAILAAAPGIIISNAMFAIGKQKKIMQFIAVAALTDIILCLLLIPKFGMYGAAIAVTTAQILGNALLIISSRKMFSLHLTMNPKLMWEEMKEIFGDKKYN